MGPQGTVPGGTSRVLAFQTPSYYPAPDSARDHARSSRRPPAEDDSPWRANPKSASPSSAWASGPSSSRSTRPTPTPRCTPSAGANKELDECGDQFGIDRRATPTSTSCSRTRTSTPSTSTRPIPDHAPQSIAALKAGKHVACTVPMATTIDECRQIVEAQRQTGKVYMMMETVVYSREYLFVKELYDRASSAASSSSAAATSRTWTAGPATGRACRRCGTPRTASARAWRLVGKHAEQRRLPRLGPHPRGADRQVRQPVRHRDGDVQDPRQRRLSPR